MTAVLGFAGVSLRPDGIAIDPHLPAQWRSLAFAVQWRGRHLTIRIEQNPRSIDATLESGEEMILAVRGEAHDLRRGQELRVSLVPNEPIRRAVDRVPSA